MRPSERILEILNEVVEARYQTTVQSRWEAILRYLDEQHELANGPECTCEYPTPQTTGPTPTCKATSHRSFM